MKKKVIALVLLVALVAALLTGCSLFETDTNRDYHQVLATVSYDTGNGVISNVIYKGEVVTYVNRYGATYMNSFGWSAEQVVEYFYNSLSRQKLLALYAQDYLYKNKLVASDFDSRFASLDAWNSYKSENPIDAYRAFMSADEFRYCVEETNEQFHDAWQDYVDEEIASNDKNSGTTEEDDEDADDEDDIDYLTARSKISASEDEESDEYVKNDAINTDADIIKYFADKYEVEISDSSVSNAYFFNYINNVIKKDIADKATYDAERTALKSVRDNSLGDILDYDYFLLQQMTSYIVEKYTDHVGTTINDTEIRENATVRYNKQVEIDLKAYVKSEDFSTAVSGGTFTYAAPSENDIQVKSILLSFTDEQSDALTLLNTLYPDNEDLVKAYRAAIATGVVDDNDKEMLELYTKLGINVNVSNPDYDADEDELKDAYTDATIEDVENAYANPAVSYLTVLYAMAEDIQAKVNRATQAAKDMTDLEQHLVKEYASKQAFNDWINLVNDDGGMFSNDYYAVTPEGESTSYVAEYTVLARELGKVGIGAMAIEEYDAVSEDPTTDSVAYEGDTAILKSANGSYTIYKKPATSSVGEDKDELATDIYTMETASGAAISFIINDYGIHIVMVTELPIDYEKGNITEKKVPTEDEDGNEIEQTMYVKGSDYVYDYTVEITYAKDEEGNEDKTKIESIKVEVTTIEDNYIETVKDELSLDVTSVQQSNLFADEDFAKKADKVFKQIMKSIQ
ncbi:MAG: hypothetical protein HDT29_06505 [Clostridiales bacterium]|nr:hypothetical protein [Clostridiales bacterium]